jgi:hypothetical protein
MSEPERPPAPPQFAEGPPVPLMTEGIIDAAMVRQLGSDLAAAAAVTGVREKAAPGAHAGLDDLPLVTAIDRLLKGAARAIQVRYRYDAREWTDTIMAVPGGFRVVRCRHEAGGSG